ncbi:hypothetical protein [Salinisphaera japonica]|uniref:hypothetical protein n=1 Tax=Salinisphaera japonica TaxID=1304270 RepID=UPI00160EC688|nr:hypothetical protein [Salinisphaera japonica]
MPDDLRLHEWRVGHAEDVRRMRLEKYIDGEWRTAGPYVSGPNTVQLMGEIVKAYQNVAQMIEDRYRHPGVERIEDGCPKCGSKAPRLVLIGYSVGFECRSCQDKAKMARYKVPRAF